MSLETSVRLSSKVIAIGHPYEDLYERFLEINQYSIDGMYILRDDISTSAQMAASGDERKRLESLKDAVEDKIRMREKHRIKLSYHDTSYDPQEADYLFKPNDFVLFLKDAAADDGSLISAGSEGQILKSYGTDRGNLVYVVKVNNKLVSAFPDNIRIAIRLSTAGEAPSYFDSATETEGAGQANPGGTTVRTHAPNLIHEKEKTTKFVYNPKTHEWDKVFEKVAKLVNGQVLPTPASVSPYANRLQQLFIPYMVNPQNEFIARQQGDELSEELTPQDKQIQITEQEDQQVKDKNQPQAPSAPATDETERQYQAKTIIADGAGTITSPSNHDRSQIEDSDNTVLQTNQDIDGPDQTHQIMTRIKDDDAIMDWLPSPSDINEDGNHKTTEGPKFWL